MYYPAEEELGQTAVYGLYILKHCNTNSSKEKRKALIVSKLSCYSKRKVKLFVYLESSLYTVRSILNREMSEFVSTQINAIQ